MKSRLSRQRILSQLETATQCLTYSMCQFEAPGGSSLLKLLVTDLWTLLWTILFMHLTRLSSPLLSKNICSVLNVKSRLLRQHILSQLETTVQYSTLTMYMLDLPPSYHTVIISSSIKRRIEMRFCLISSLLK